MDHKQKDFLSSLIPGNNQSQTSNSFSPFLSGNNNSTVPSSPNTQLTMNLLTNLMQMQGLETSIAQQQMENATSSSGGSSSSSYPPHLLEQQIKLTQLQQLQQLQNQIFQQQIALISGRSPLILSPGQSTGSESGHYTGLPTPGPSGEIRPQRASIDFSTPSSGNYMEPLPNSFISSQNSFPSQHNRQGSSSRSINLNLQRQLQALANSQPITHQQHSTYPSSPAFHSTSPMHSHPVSPMQQAHSITSQQQHHHDYNSNIHSHPHSNAHAHQSFQTPHSAPESLAFHIYSGPLPGGGSSVPGLMLEPPVDDAQPQTHAHRGSISHTPILDQDISPLTSPWLGARSTTSVTSSTTRSGNSNSSGNTNKRTASSSGDEGGSARKKQSPAIRPTLAMSVVRKAGERERDRGSSNSPKKGLAPSPLPGPGDGNGEDPRHPSSPSGSGSGSVSPDPSSQTRSRLSVNEDSTLAPSSSASNSGTGSNQHRPYRGSKSTNSTPLLRSTHSPVNGSGHGRTRSKTRAPASAGLYGAVVQDSPSPVDLNVVDSSNSTSVPNTATSDNHDRSMPPPPFPVSFLGASGNKSGFDEGNGSMNMNVGDLEMGFDEMMGVHIDLNQHEHHMNANGNMNGGGLGVDMNGMNMNSLNDMGLDMDMSMDGTSYGTNVGIMDMDFSQQHHNPPPNDAQNTDHEPSGQFQQQHHHQTQSQQQHILSTLSSQQQQHLMPVTPASIMNLGRLGIPSTSTGNGRLASSTSSTSGLNPANSGASNGSGSSSAPLRKSSRKEALSAAAKAKESQLQGTTTSVIGSTTTTRSGRQPTKKSTLVSPSLKPLLPAGSITPGVDLTLPGPPGSATPSTPFMNVTAGASSSSTSTSAGPRKTSHKAAEQKRRDSLKTTFDDLRKLLPPIALPNDADIDPSAITSPFFHPTAPLLPGALPPRGPPKAGGDGPNKGVSKLQLLICGNEYIRLLKGRVDRRDDEIDKLRKEIGKLRMIKERDIEIDVGEDDGAEELNLEKDLDAVEKVQVQRAIANLKGLNASGSTATATPLVSSVAGGGGGPDEGMDEGDDEDDD